MSHAFGRGAATHRAGVDDLDREAFAGELPGTEQAPGAHAHDHHLGGGLDLHRMGSAEGVEVFVSRRGGGRWNWWVGYALSEVTDRIDGVDVPRSIDQTHALTVDLSWRLGRRWNLDLVWLYHTGWPITAVGARFEDGAVVPVLGPLNGERVDDYHRLDLRASRQFQLRRRGQLELYLDVQNLYNRENERGYEFGEDAFEVQPDGSVNVTPEVDTWLGAVPSFGLTWSF